MEKRKTSKVELPISPDIQILHPNLSSASFANKNLDIGILCYTEVDINKGCSFNPESLLKSRMSAVLDLFIYASELVESSLKGESVYTRLNNFRRFVVWCDDNSQSGVLDGFSEARISFEEYILYLKNRISLGNLHNNTAARYQ